MKKLFITGANGLVGRHLIQKINRNPKHSYELLTPTRYTLDLRNQQAVAQYIKTHQPDCIIHLAAVVGGIKANMTQPVRFLVENQQMSLNVISAAHTLMVPRLLNMGTACMYPKDREILKETDLLTGPLEPTNEAYAIAKISAARLCHYIDQQPGFSYKTIVPTNLYGPHDNFDPETSHLIPAIIRKLSEAKQQQIKTVSIWGDGEARREFMYVEDLIDFMLIALDRFEELPSMINVGLNEDYTINEYYKIAANIIGYEGHFEHDLTKPVGMRKKLLDSQHARSFGWSPKITLQAGIQKTVNYFLTEVSFSGCNKRKHVQVSE